MMHTIIKIASITILCTTLSTSCSFLESNEIVISPSKQELYDKADGFVESLQTKYESYGILNATDYAVTTTDGLYQVMPVGRLINVKILKAVDSKTYEELKQELTEHYKSDTRVRNVYISNAGTIMIDCRN